MAASSLFPFLLLCLTVELTPGPNMAYLAVLTVNAGKRAGFAAVAGIALGLLMIGALAAFGVAALIAQSVLLSRLLLGVGVIYLLWLAWSTWHESPSTDHNTDGPATKRATYFKRGIITNLLNPKAFLFYAAVLPSFVGGHVPATAYALMLTLISVTIATIVHITIVILGSQFRPYLIHPRRQRMVRRVMALMLAAIAGWLAFSNAALIL
jgi:threonine/homoserine/homoserine lactone efflux protein